MARYFFDMNDGDFFSRDEEGAQFAIFEDVESEAVRAITDLVRGARSASKLANIGVAVRNEAGQTILTMRLTLDIVRTPQ